MAMPWSRAKSIRAEYLSGVRDKAKLTALFDACFRIQREAIEASGHFIPLVVENVRGAQEWVGRSRWNYGSFHLWGDVPALMPIARNAVKVPSFRFDGSGKSFQTASVRRTDPGKGARFTSRDCGIERCCCENPEPSSGAALVSMECPIHNDNPYPRQDGFKSTGMNWSDRSRRGQDFTRIAGNQAAGTKQHGSGREWFAGEGKISRVTSSRSPARKAASAMIAKIPIVLSRHIAATWRPRGAEDSGGECFD